MLLDRVRRFLADPASASFDELALEAFAFQYERIPAYRALCDRRGATPAIVRDWREVPLVPAGAFRTLTLAAGPAAEVFRSSGTSSGAEARSVHHHAFPDLYRAAVDASFPAFCLPQGGRPPMLALVPSRELAPDSSLSFMVDHVLGRWGGPGSATALGPRGVDFPAFRSWCSARQRDKRPGLVLATALALVQALDRLARLDLRFRLPPGTAVFETGGFKGRVLAVTREELVRQLEERLAVPPAAVVREYGMTELTSQCYTRALTGGDPDLFVAPHWMRGRVLDPLSLAEAPPATTGLLALFDLANLSSAVHLLTEDLGTADGDGFRLVGRAAGGALRGCSLTAEELPGADGRG